MQIVVTGASGFLGSALVPALRAADHQVVRLVRRTPQADNEVRWSPAEDYVDTPALLDHLGHVDAAIHLAGAGIGDKRWTPAYKRAIRTSRTEGTGTLARTLAGLTPRPQVLVSASAIGFYGDTGDRAVTEQAPSGTTFTASIVRDWEAATRPAQDAGIRVVLPRTGLVMDGSGGAFARLLLLLRLGLGGPLGSGRQYWSWITLADWIGATRFVLEPAASAPTDQPEDARQALSGPVNFTSPQPLPNRDVVRALARAVHRPALLPAPSLALRIALGEFASEVTMSQRVLPERLQRAGYRFEHPDIAAAARAVA